MDHHPLGQERLIGWLSFAMGLSALQPNDSVFYKIIIYTGFPLAWVIVFTVAGFALVASTHINNTRCRMALMIILLVAWTAGLWFVASTGPLGAYGVVSIVIILHLLRILYVKVRDGAYTSI